LHQGAEDLRVTRATGRPRAPRLAAASVATAQSRPTALGPADLPAPLLIVEPDPATQEQLLECCAGLHLVCASSNEEALALLRRVEPQVVLFDIDCGSDPVLEEQQLAHLQEILGVAPFTRVIAIVGPEQRALAARAVGSGAVDFYMKPVERLVLPLIVRRALRIRELEEDNRRLREGLPGMIDAGVLGTSDGIRAAFQLIGKVAPTKATVLLLGESGTGKEIFARALHQQSERANRAFFAINCAAIPDGLLESELFGYEKGAFTGAVRQTPGRFERAEGGTVLLDEIGEMSPALQAKLLRVLQERSVERLGGHASIPLDLRIICATNRELVPMIAQGKFREDLYYRISEVTIRIPPLRERGGDCLILANYFLRESARQNRRAVRGFTAGALRAIQTCRWPGNVRELENRVSGAVITADGALVTAADLGLVDSGEQVSHLNLRAARQCAEREAIRQALALAEGNITKAAELLGVTRPTLYDLLARHALGSGGAESKTDVDLAQLDP
jgi:two-component system, NtrC family, response regulator